jgi:hypothetical protein
MSEALVGPTSTEVGAGATTGKGQKSWRSQAYSEDTMTLVTLATDALSHLVTLGPSHTRYAVSWRLAFSFMKFPYTQPIQKAPATQTVVEGSFRLKTVSVEYIHLTRLSDHSLVNVDTIHPSVDILFVILPSRVFILWDLRITQVCPSQ